MRNNKLNLVILTLYFVLSLIINFYDIKLYNFYINPIFWTIFMIYQIYKTDNNHGRFKNLNENIKMMLIITLFYIILNFLGGLVFGFRRNPYSNEFLTFIKNIWQLIIPIIGIEYVRSAIVNKADNNKFSIILITLIIILLEINFSNFLNTKRGEEFFKYISSIIIPIVTFNILYTYLSIKGSYKLVLIYRLITEIIFLIVPILPNYDWFVSGIRDIITVLVIYVIMKYHFDFRTERENSKNRKKVNPYFFLIFCFIIIIFVLFLAGVFKYKPIAILSNSMNPVFQRGDVVVYSKVSNKKLKKLKLYTIIVYSKDNQVVVHRVVKKYDDKGNHYFITKGDANNSEDFDPVSMNQVIGIYEFNIKYIGYPSVWLNEMFKKEKAKVEIK